MDDGRFITIGAKAVGYSQTLIFFFFHSRFTSVSLSLSSGRREFTQNCALKTNKWRFDSLSVSEHNFFSHGRAPNVAQKSPNKDKAGSKGTYEGI